MRDTLRRPNLILKVCLEFFRYKILVAISGTLYILYTKWQKKINLNVNLVSGPMAKSSVLFAKVIFTTDNRIEIGYFIWTLMRHNATLIKMRLFVRFYCCLMGSEEETLDSLLNLFEKFDGVSFFILIMVLLLICVNINSIQGLDMCFFQK